METKDNDSCLGVIGAGLVFILLAIGIGEVGKPIAEWLSNAIFKPLFFIVKYAAIILAVVVYTMLGYYILTQIWEPRNFSRKFAFLMLLLYIISICFGIFFFTHIE